MAKSKKKRSPVVPVLVAALTCDVACADKHDAPKPWTFLQPGRYSMQVYANDAYMGSARIEAVKR